VKFKPISVNFLLSKNLIIMKVESKVDRSNEISPSKNTGQFDKCVQSDAKKEKRCNEDEEKN
jgi:hypothetical protein